MGHDRSYSLRIFMSTVPQLSFIEPFKSQVSFRVLTVLRIAQRVLIDIVQPSKICLHTQLCLLIPVLRMLTVLLLDIYYWRLPEQYVSNSLYKIMVKGEKP